MYTQDNKEVYGGFFVRLMAFWVDSIIAGCIAMIIKLPINLMTLTSTDSIFTKNFIFHHSAIDVISYIIVVMYFILTTYFTHTTVGKYVFRLRVENINNEWNFINIVYRETIGRFLSSLLCIGYIVLAIDKEKRGFHDMLSDTRVVYSVKMIERKIVKTVVPPMNQQQDINNSRYYIKND